MIQTSKFSFFISFSLFTFISIPTGHIPHKVKQNNLLIQNEEPSVSKTYHQNNLTVQVKPLKKSEIPHLFEFPAAFLYNVALADNIIPIQIIIRNNSKERCFISPNDIEGTILSCQEIIQLSQKNNWKNNKYHVQKKVIRIAGIIGGAFGGFIGYLFPAILHCGPALPFGIYAGSILIGIAIGLVVGIAYGIYEAFLFTIGQLIRSLINDIHMKRTIKRNTLHKKVTIKPGREYSTCLFLVNNNNTVLPITIHSQKNNISTRFDIDLFEINQSSKKREVPSIA